MTRKRIPSSRQVLTKDQETIRLVNECFVLGDVKELRRIAAARGLVNSHLRRKAWPLLLGLDPTACRPLEPEEYSQLAAAHGSHRDRTVIEVDVARCLHQTNSYVGDHNRLEARERLLQLLNAVVDGRRVYYYQGLHELASVLMLEVGDAVAYHALQHLAVTHLRDNTRANLDATLEALNIVSPLLRAADAPLAAHLAALELPPYFAISWMLTWFAHDVKSMAAITRLFDLFMACHPLMPLYFGVSAMLQVRKQLLAAESMPEAHTILVNLDVLNVGLSLDALALHAAQLLVAHPPARLAPALPGAPRRCATLEARLLEGRWWVPESLPPSGGLLTSAAIDWMLRVPASLRHGRVLLRVLTSTGAVVASAALVYVMNARGPFSERPPL